MKYEALEAFLQEKGFEEIPLSFSEIEKIIGRKLPPSARKHRPWWSNNPSNSTITHAWLNAGYKTERVDMGSEKLVFRRMRRKPSTPTPPAAPPAQAEERPKGRFPLLGCLKGSVRVMPGVDLTEPVDVTWNAQEGRL